MIRLLMIANAGQHYPSPRPSQTRFERDGQSFDLCCKCRVGFKKLLESLQYKAIREAVWSIDQDDSWTLRFRESDRYVGAKESDKVLSDISVDMKCLPF